MKNLSKKLISVLMALMFTIAPLSFAFAIKIPWLTTYPSEKEVAETLGNFLKARDVDGIAGMFSEEVKSELADLNVTVERFLNQIDCDIKDCTYSGRGNTEDRSNGHLHKSCSFDLEIKTESKIYVVIARYVQVWTDNEKKVGLRSLGLTLLDANGNLIDYLNGVEVKRPTLVTLNYKGTYQCNPCKQFWKDTYASIGYNKLVITSSDESVAKVDSDGIVTATGRGSARVTVTYINETTGKELEYLYDVTVTFTRWQWIIWYLFFGFLWY